MAELELSAETQGKSLFGFWVYIMTDCVLFASLFAVFAVLYGNTNGGVSGGQLFSLPYVLTETFVLLTSSFTMGLAMLSVRAEQVKRGLFWLFVTFALGTTFVVMELHEFSNLVRSGDSWTRSGFLSSYFTLVGTHGLHVSIGLLWMAVMFIRIATQGINKSNLRRLTMLSLFWHFLDIVWIFIFTIVYLRGAVIG